MTRTYLNDAVFDGTSTEHCGLGYSLMPPLHFVTRLSIYVQYRHDFLGGVVVAPGLNRSLGVNVANQF